MSKSPVNEAPMSMRTWRSSHGNIAVGDILRLLRPSNWIKNLLVVLPILFARRMDDPSSWIMILTAAAAFCLASSAIYAINDIKDRNVDRMHPHKRKRPVASGRVSCSMAGIVSVLLGMVALGLASIPNEWVLVAVVCYMVLQVVYIFELKQRPILDVMCIATGFVLRAVAGAFAIRVEITSWLIVCVFTLCLFMSFCKRWNESVVIAGDPSCMCGRKTLTRYAREFLTHLVTLSATIAIISYLLYVLSPATIERFGTQGLICTLPMV